MRLPERHRVIPVLLAGVAAAIPIGTTVDILARVADASSAGTPALRPVAVAGAAATATPEPQRSTVTPRPAAAPASPRRTATAATRATATPAAVTPKVYAGAVVYDQYGAVQATVTVTGRKITNVTISAPQGDPRSAGINSQAVPMLVSETLQAQSANVNVISGATETSNAYQQSLQAALQKAGL